MRVAIDVDSVLADILPLWVKRYNEAANDTLEVEKIVTWDMNDYVKPEWRGRLSSLLGLDFYDSVPPIANALEGVEILRKHYDVIFVTACSTGTYDQKHRWLRTHGFLKHRNEYVAAFDKTLVDAYILIDDAPHNLMPWARMGLRAVIFDQPYNRMLEGLRLKGWNEVESCVFLSGR